MISRKQIKLLFIEGSGVLEYEYDANNRLVRVKDVELGKEIRYEYDARGNRTGIKVEGESKGVSYGYGKMNEVVSVRGADGRVTEYEYDKLGREIKRKLPSGIVTEKIYDAAGRIKGIINMEERGWGWCRRLKSYGYIYDKAGERIYQVEGDGGITAYKYDMLGRVKEVEYPWSSGKKVEDFKERLELGMYSKGAERGKGEIRLELPYLGMGGKGEKELRDRVKDLLKGDGKVKKGAKRAKGRWVIGIGEGATEFALRLEVGYEEEDALRGIYEIISERDRYLDTGQWMWKVLSPI